VKKLRARRSTGKSARRRARWARRTARFGAPDASLTGSAGVLALGELMDRLGVIEALDTGIGPIKTRALGVTAGELVAGLAQCQLLDGKFVNAVDRHRADTAAQALSAVPAVASTTVGGLTRCFGPDRVAGIEAGNAQIIARGWALLGEQRRTAVLTGRIGIDLDATDVEVYGRLKRGVAYNYLGQRAGRPHLATWADTGLTLAADLLTGVQDVRAHSSALLGRAVAALPAEVRDSFSDTHRPAVRADAGYFAAELAHTAVGLGCDFAVAAKRNPAMWRAAAAIGEQDWSPANRMTGAQVAVCDYAPAGWPPGTYTIIHRVRVDAADISTDPRSRRRRTIDRDQLALLLDGVADHGWATSFIVTNLPTGGDGFDTATDVEAWFGDAHRHRGPHPRSQARRWAHPPTLGLRRDQHRVDVGRPARREPLHPAASPHRHRHRHTRPRPRRPAAPRAAPRPRPRHPPRPQPHPATTPRPRPPAPGHGLPAGPARPQRLSTPPPPSHHEPGAGTRPPGAIPRAHSHAHNAKQAQNSPRHQDQQAHEALLADSGQTTPRGVTVYQRGRRGRCPVACRAAAPATPANHSPAPDRGSYAADPQRSLEANQIGVPTA